MREQVILVDRDDTAIGSRPKWTAHVEGALHRAVSVVVFNGEGRMLLQRRAATKYHSGGLWSNACCSHPRPGEETLVAAQRRLHEEMGLSCALEPAFTFLYRASVGGGLIEHELDHVFIGRTDAEPRADSLEVDQWRWAAPADVARDLAEGPQAFTAWFPLLFSELHSRGYLPR